MVKIKSKAFSTRVPVLTFRGAELQPDLLLAIKDGKAKISCLNPVADLSKLIYQVDCYLDLLKDMKWAATQAQAKRGKK